MDYIYVLFMFEKASIQDVKLKQMSFFSCVSVYISLKDTKVKNILWF